MRICVVGGGGREHALCWALSASPLVDALICAPGNGGISEIARCVPVAADDITGLIDMARREQIDFVVVGPELPLVAGLVDRLEAAGIPAFGPTAAAAELESSKGFTKDLCRRYDIPTARYQRFNEREAAKQYVRAAGAPIVVKADGLAAGKGVVLAQSQSEAFQAIDDILGGQFGTAGNEVVIEEYLQGEEASFFALVDGENVLPLATAQDHKAAHDGDSGPNTGGMGAYSPAPVMTETLTAQVLDTIIKPTVKAMADMGRPFKGVLFAGLMLTESGPQLLEYNVRFGDPECQVLMMRLQSDLLPALIAARDGELKDFDLRWRQEVALTVVLASRGYPGAYTTGSTISNLDQAAAPDHIEIFHAGTARQDGNIVATGGRVLGVTALGATVSEAQMRAYAAIKTIDWPEGFYRSDIGWRAVAREAAS